eukprot:TRINITY_DN63727_c0_g1_i1.p1 TRINITY_DN63727_c0_g1~~TRINITY_DN63727_c0_g1_i1.p1  ORF type:complete len:123 (+),score=21.98 TRINITY_DN63727_c0_g1_i1:96-464(+)
MKTRVERKQTSLSVSKKPATSSSTVCTASKSALAAANKTADTKMVDTEKQSKSVAWTSTGSTWTQTRTTGHEAVDLATGKAVKNTVMTERRIHLTRLGPYLLKRKTVTIVKHQNKVQRRTRK